MKKILILSLSLLISGMGLFAQNNQGTLDDAGRIMLTAFVPDQLDEISPSVKSNLQNKLSQIVAKNGMTGGVNQRFIITANIQVQSKNVTPSAPPKHAYTMDVTLYIGDGLTGTLFSSETFTLKGVGDTETKAYAAALKNLKVNDPKYQSFIEKGKVKIIEYYNTQCDFIVKEAEMLAATNEYEAAIAKLIEIPQVSKDCYNKALAAISPIYQKMIDRDCRIKLQEAQGIWNAAQDMDAANKAGAILATIEPDAACFKDVQALATQIAKKVKEIDNREWQYILKDQAQESERIEAMRQVGVAYGNNQPQNVQYNYKGWW